MVVARRTLAIGVLLIVRGRINGAKVPVEAIKVVSVSYKEGTLALNEVHDGDSRKRRLLVGLGGGAPRLVADVSAWEVAVAAPSNIANDAVAIVGPDPEEQASVEEIRPQLRVAPKAFETHLAQAADRFDDQDVSKDNKADLEEWRELDGSPDILSGTKGLGRQADTRARGGGMNAFGSSLCWRPCRPRWLLPKRW